MDHQSFRFYIPGIVFLTPIYIVICWITVYYTPDPDLRSFVLLGGIAAFPAISLPVGWWIYNAYRILWLAITNGGYENKDFVRLVREETKPFYSPLTQSILIDLSNFKDIKSWIKIDSEVFRKVFYPFTSLKDFKKEIEQNRIRTKFTEHLSDYILFKDKAYDYARSISSIRYGLESSIFALILGVLYALGLRYIWLFYLKQTNNEIIFTFWIVFSIFLTFCMLFILAIRWKYANREYDARLDLTTVISLSSNYFDVRFFEEKIPSEINSSIDLLGPTGKSYAAFDLDNTLLIDDIGEAVLAALLKKKLVTNFSWKEYTNQLEKDRKAAYKKTIEVMSGIKIAELKKVTHELLDSEETYIDLSDRQIPIPKPNPIMQSIIDLLRTKGIDVYIVTASNNVSAEIISWKYFGIPSSNVLGAGVFTDKKGRIIYNETEIPYAEGKVAALEKKLKNKPIVTGGDGAWDKYLLDYTCSNGIRLWLGTDKNQYQKFKNAYYQELNFYHIERG